MGFVSGIAMINNMQSASLFGTPVTYASYGSLAFNPPSLYDIYVASFSDSFKPGKVLEKNYTEEFRKKTVESGSKFQYPASSQQIKRNTGQYLHNTSLGNSYNALKPKKVFDKDYAKEFRQKTGRSGSKFKYTASSQQIKRNAGQYFHKKGTYTPQRGDIAIWTKTADPAHGHVGIVTKIEGDTVWITEGNSGNAVKTNKYSLSKLMSNSGSRPLNGFIDAHSWLGSDTALKAAERAEVEKAKGVVESNTSGGGSNDSVDIRRYKRGAQNSNQWCANFTSYCFTDGQNLNSLA